MSLCSRYRAFNTSYNGDGDIPSYTGVFFEIAALKRPIEIQTLELDIVGSLNNTDKLSVEVFSVAGTFQDVFNQPDVWDLVADSKLVPVLDGNGAIIPAAEFMSVHIPAGERFSLYVTLTETGLDHNVHGLQKTGDRHIYNDDIQLFVGAGTNEYKFPATLHRSPFPMFAGVVHYRFTEDCSIQDQITTAFSVNFLVDLPREDFRLILADVVAKLYGVMLQRDGALGRPYVMDPVKLENTYTCPSDWRECPRFYYQTKLSWFHDERVFSAGRIKYEMFGPRVLRDMNSRVQKRGKQILSLDLQSREVAFDMSLLGKSQISIVSASQARYIEFVMKRFLDSCIGSDSIVWDIDTSFSVSNAEESLYQVTVSGSVLGAAKHKGDLLKDVQLCFDSRGDAFLVQLSEAGRIQPQFESEWEPFRLTEFSLAGFAYTEVEPKDVDGSQHSNLLAVILLIMAGVTLLLVLGLVVRAMKTRMLRYREIEEYRSAMRVERRQKRTMRASSAVTVDNNLSRSYDREPSGASESAVHQASAAGQIQLNSIDRTAESPEVLHFEPTPPRASAESESTNDEIVGLQEAISSEPHQSATPPVQESTKTEILEKACSDEKCDEIDDAGF